MTTRARSPVVTLAPVAAITQEAEPATHAPISPEREIAVKRVMITRV
jgi:hypothetical protein